MSELPKLRQGMFGRTWSVVSTARSRRPHSALSSTCPFCAGNEGETEREVFALRRADSRPDTSGWSLRVVPNKYPALLNHVDLSFFEQHPFVEAAGRGFHEVIIETPDHEGRFSRSSAEHLHTVLAVYQQRLRVLSREPSVQSVAVVRNEGREAGASQDHPHSQVFAFPQVHSRLAYEVDHGGRHFEAEGRCLTCTMIEQEIGRGRRLVACTDDFVALASFAPRFPYELWILPRVHGHDFASEGDDRIRGLAAMLKRVLVALEGALGTFPYNLVLLTSPLRTSSSLVQSAFHWRFEILPRLSTPSGLELGCDMFVVSVSPEDAAVRLRPLVETQLPTVRG
jgi:UDPglucose--hexose-1-phosphate uridylyltransferase